MRIYKNTIAPSFALFGSMLSTDIDTLLLVVCKSLVSGILWIAYIDIL